MGHWIVVIYCSLFVEHGDTIPRPLSRHQGEAPALLTRRTSRHEVKVFWRGLSDMFPDGLETPVNYRLPRWRLVARCGLAYEMRNAAGPHSPKQPAAMSGDLLQENGALKFSAEGLLIFLQKYNHHNFNFTAWRAEKSVSTFCAFELHALTSQSFDRSHAPPEVGTCRTKRPIERRSGHRAHDNDLRCGRLRYWHGDVPGATAALGAYSEHALRR